MDINHQILKTLKQKFGEWVSGQELGEVFQVSRTSIWKHIKKLQAQGYEIESSPKKGYRLGIAPDRLSAEEVVPGLDINAFGRERYYYFDEIDSTNDYAKKLAAQGCPEGTVVVAEMQNTGRGRRGRSWFSPSSQGLYFSLVLRPELPLREIPRIPLVVAAAVAAAIADEYRITPQIKWPNDIWIDNRKIAGILTEAAMDMDGVEYVIAGIGINANNRIDDFPDDLRTPPTSLQAVRGVPVSRVQLLQTLLGNLHYYYNEMLRGNFPQILEKVRAISLVMGQKVRWEEPNGIMDGTALEIDDEGFLRVEDTKGEIHTIMSGEIMLVSTTGQ